MSRVLVAVWNHVFSIESFGEPVDQGGAYIGGLVRPRGTRLDIFTNRYAGPVPVAFEFLDADTRDAVDDWEDVCEASMDVSQGALTLSSFDDSWALPKMAPTLGSTRVRIHARGRGIREEWDEVLDDVTEEYLLQMWPAPPAPPEILLQSTDPGGTS
jgi:hypothetical protein